MIRPFIFSNFRSGLQTCILILIALVIISSGYQAATWWSAHQLNQAYAQQIILHQAPLRDKPLQAYSIGYLQAKHHKLREAARAFTIAEASRNDEIRALAKFALANLYFDLALGTKDQAGLANIAAGGSHQQAAAQIELARESYKAALRLNPVMYAARYNLELLDRLSPEKRTQAWKSETDGVTLQPFKRNGTAMMKDNRRRGLP